MKSPAKVDLLGALPEVSRPLVRRVLRSADEQRMRVYLVGGPVRDWLMGRPLRDVDLCVEPRDGKGASELGRRMQGSGLRVRVHERFGTVTLLDGPGSLDLATVRSETYAHAGALPSVAAGTLEQDLRRRDFSVNAMALPLSQAARARGVDVVDVAGGLDDLARGRLRILHPQSFHDDPTRALRAARLAPRLGFAVTRDTRVALRNALRDGVFGRVSGDRLRRELVRVFDDTAVGLEPSRALRLLHEWHVLAALEPGLALDRAASVPLRRLGRTLLAPPWPLGRSRAWVAGTGLWLAPLPLALRRRALRRFAIRGALADRLLNLPKRCDSWQRNLARARGRGAVDAALEGIDEESLLALYSLAEPAARRRVARWAAHDRARRPPVSGDDLVAIGLAGPAVGRALRRVRTSWLDGTIRSRDEALALAQELYRRGRR
ncbi:MAG: CCA tRNA nucleotidyltransferase [Deltaproteobacteria bacterium]|nr:CCA tRNA nucleotidyltransferase [Deltaproteobacteria bacterium]